MPADNSITRKTVSLSDPLWRQIDDFRFHNRYPTEAEATRFLLERGLVPWPTYVTAAHDRLAGLPDQLGKLMSSLPPEHQIAVADILAEAKAALLALQPLHEEAIALTMQRRW